jgi:hypothetical protein
MYLSGKKSFLKTQHHGLLHDIKHGENRYDYQNFDNKITLYYVLNPIRI